MRLQAHGIELELPAGYEGRIFRRPEAAGAVSRPVLHVATFPLPAVVADFGAGAVTLMGPSDVFVVLFEYGPESLGTRLFARRGMPRALGPQDFRPFTLRRGIVGQSGTQWFFTEVDRPFTLYAALGRHADRARLAGRVNAVLERVLIHPADDATAPAPAVARS